MSIQLLCVHVHDYVTVHNCVCVCVCVCVISISLTPAGPFPCPMLHGIEMPGMRLDISSWYSMRYANLHYSFLAIVIIPVLRGKKTIANKKAIIP